MGKKKPHIPQHWLDAVKPRLGKLWTELWDRAGADGVAEATIRELMEALDDSKELWVHRWLKQLRALGVLAEIEAAERLDDTGKWRCVVPVRWDSDEGEEDGVHDE